MPRFKVQKKQETREKNFADQYQQSRLNYVREQKADRQTTQKISGAGQAVSKNVEKAYNNAFGNKSKEQTRKKK